MAGAAAEGAGVSATTAGTLGLACVEKTRGSTHATATRAATAITAPSPIQSPRRGPAVVSGGGMVGGTGVNGGG